MERKQIRRAPSRQWQDWTVLLLGAWLLLSPFLLDQNHAAATSNAHIVGLCFVLFGAVALVEPRMWEEWLNLALGGWLVVSPFVLGFAHHPVAAWNAITVGFIAGGGVLLLILRH